MLPFPIAIAAQWPRVLTLSPSTGGVSGFTLTPDTCYAGIEYRSDGSEWAAQHENSAYDGSRGNWLDRGNADEIWIQWVRSGGTLSDWNSADAGDARLNFDGSNYDWRIERSSLGVSTIIGAFNFWNAASGGTMIATTGTLIFQATVDI